MKIQEKFKRLVRLLFSAVLVTVVSGIYGYTWINYFNTIIRLPFFRRGNWMMIFLYIVILFFMMKMYGGGMDMSMFGAEGETLVLNANHPLVTYITEHEDDANTEMICEQLYDLAKLQNAPLSPEAMTKFVARSNDIMLLLAKQ